MNINPRLNRLQSDYEKIRELESRSPMISIVKTMGGNPPTGYIFRLTCQGITRLSNGRPAYSEQHELKMILQADYPRAQPTMEMLTPIFHPNFNGRTICIGHSYSPAMGLDDLLVEIIKLIIYENYNLASAYNHEAVDWAKRNKKLFPLDKRQIVGKDPQIEVFEEINIIDNSDDLIKDIDIFS